MNLLAAKMNWLKSIHHKLDEDYADIGCEMGCQIVDWKTDEIGPFLLCAALPAGDVTEAIMTQSVQRTVIVDGVRFVSYRAKRTDEVLAFVPAEVIAPSFF